MNRELYHHGVIGQKWGVRRYQNEDGTLTEAGKRRYRYGTVEVERIDGVVLLDNGRKVYGVNSDTFSEMEKIMQDTALQVISEQYHTSVQDVMKRIDNPKTMKQVNDLIDSAMDKQLNSIIEKYGRSYN